MHTSTTWINKVHRRLEQRRNFTDKRGKYEGNEKMPENERDTERERETERGKKVVYKLKWVRLVQGSTVAVIVAITAITAERQQQKKRNKTRRAKKKQRRRSVAFFPAIFQQIKMLISCLKTITETILMAQYPPLPLPSLVHSRPWPSCASCVNYQYYYCYHLNTWSSHVFVARRVLQHNGL